MKVISSIHRQRKGGTLNQLSKQPGAHPGGPHYEPHAHAKYEPTPINLANRGREEKFAAAATSKDVKGRGLPPAEVEGQGGMKAGGGLIGEVISRFEKKGSYLKGKPWLP
ncbi:hypothetical protein E2562_023413 [Oryza meyeriana var. granulata]|uniref:Uncharacterized protein n=1 Tax=Oryza meyeriana var. granulata TaxID=110450 RepID=A0A6G1FB62_9ORYZ|nr:hypothetical protein E2562_023413 [Oryza meyeriana var. granulata]